MQKFKEFYNSADSTKIAFIPGSWAPPHEGHWQMIKHYSKIVGPDGKVIVVVSAPSKDKRLTSAGKEITPEDRVKIFKIFEDVTKLGNVEFVISDIPSPVTWASEHAKSDYNSPKYEIIFGVSKKDEDLARFSFLKKWHEKEGLKFKLADAAKYAAPAYKNFSASDIRDHIDDEKLLASMMPKELDEKDLAKIHGILSK